MVLRQSGRHRSRLIHGGRNWPRPAREGRGFGAEIEP